MIGWIISTVWAASALAGTETGPVDALQVGGANILLYLGVGSSQPAESQPPACKTVNGFAIPLSSALGQQLLPILANAKASGLTVSVNGAGTCNASAGGGYEDVASINVSGTPISGPPGAPQTVAICTSNVLPYQGNGPSPYCQCPSGHYVSGPTIVGQTPYVGDSITSCSAIASSGSCTGGASTITLSAGNQSLYGSCCVCSP